VTERDELERRVHGFGPDVTLGARARAGLLDALAGEHAERDRHRQRRGQLRESARDRMREHIEVRRVAAYQAAQRYHGVVTSGPRERGDRRRQLERPRHLELVDSRSSGQGALQRPLRQGTSDLFVPSGPYECHAGRDKPVSHSRGRLPSHRQQAQSSPRMRSPRVAR